MTDTPRLKWGEGPKEFARLAALETDECVVWPYSINAYRGGYGTVHVDGAKQYCHRLALALREPAPSPQHQAAHGPCISPACMNYRHLRWATQTENEADKLRDGTRNRGERHGNARLTWPDVAEIRRRYARGDVTQTALGRAYGIHKMQISKIVRNTSWVVSCDYGWDSHWTDVL